MITKDDFLSWRESFVTQTFLNAVIEEMNLSVADLIWKAGLDSMNDRFHCGRIDGLKWLTEWQPNFIEENEEDESGDTRA